WTALHLFAYLDWDVQLLFQGPEKPEIDKRDADYLTALDVAALVWNAKAANVLLEHGAELTWSTLAQAASCRPAHQRVPTHPCVAFFKLLFPRIERVM